MLRAMIVEDEPAHRLGLIRHVGWNRLGYAQPTDVPDAEEALRRLEREPVDVLLVDIRMLGMDGIALVQMLRQRHPKLYVLIISAYDEFEYARRAVEVGAAAYLLKPVKIEEVERWLAHFHDEYRLARQIAEEERMLLYKWKGSLELARTKVLEELLEDRSDRTRTAGKAWQKQMELLDMPYDDLCARLILFVPGGSAQTCHAGPSVFPAAQVLAAAGQALSDDGVVVAAQLQPNAAAVLFIAEAVCEFGLRPLLESKLAAIRSTLGNAGFGTVSICVSEEVQGWKQIPAAYRNAWLALERADSADGLALWADEVDVNAAGGTQSLGQLQALLYEKIAIADLPGYRSLLLRFFSCMDAEDGVPFGYVHAICCGLAEKLIRMSEAQGARMDGESADIWRTIVACTDRAALKSALLRISDRCAEAVSATRSGNKHQLVEKAVAYLHAHLQDNVTVKRIAGEVHLNAAYLSVLFKKEMGLTISDYLQRIRIEKAKQLLRDPNEKVYEIADKVGYQTSSYFTLQFKKAVGCTPMEFRKRRL